MNPELLKPIPASIPLLFISLAGCGYWKDRGKDFLDPLGIQFSRGRGIELNVHATHFLQAGFSLNPEGTKQGFLGRRSMAKDFEMVEELGFSPVAYYRKVTYSPFDRKTRTTTLGWTRSLNEKDGADDPLPRNPIRAYEAGYDRRLFDVGFSLPFVIPYSHAQPFQGVCLHLDFNPYEVADLVLGLLTIDIAGDDREPE